MKVKIRDSTPIIQAPECVAGIFSEPSLPSEEFVAGGNLIDVWAMAVCLWYCASNGGFPFGGGEEDGGQSIFQIYRAIVEDEVSYPEEFSREFSDFLRCCFKKNPKDRSNAKQLLDHL